LFFLPFVSVLGSTCLCCWHHEPERAYIFFHVVATCLRLFVPPDVSCYNHTFSDIACLFFLLDSSLLFVLVWVLWADVVLRWFHLSDLALHLQLPPLVLVHSHFTVDRHQILQQHVIISRLFDLVSSTQLLRICNAPTSLGLVLNTACLTSVPCWGSCSNLTVQR